MGLSLSALPGDWLQRNTLHNGETDAPWVVGTGRRGFLLPPLGENQGFLNPYTSKQVSQVHKSLPLSHAASSDLSFQWMTKEENDEKERECSLARSTLIILLFAPKINKS